MAWLTTNSDGELKVDAGVELPYIPILQAGGFQVAADAAGTYGIGSGEQLSSVNEVWTEIINWVPASFAITDKTTQWRMRLDLTSNAADPAMTWVGHIYPITGYAGGAGNLSYTLGASVASTAAISPGAASFASAFTGVVNAPASGIYGMFVVTSGALAANSVVRVNSQLEINHV